MRRQLEHRAVPAAELELNLAALALCIPVVARFGERSCGARAAAEQLALPPPEPLAEHSRKPPALPVKTSSQPAEPEAALEQL